MTIATKTLLMMKKKREKITTKDAMLTKILKKIFVLYHLKDLCECGFSQ